MSKFSQGKWYKDTAGVVRCDDEYVRSIAYLITSEPTKELDEANARLIIAAPEMYELIKDALRMCKGREVYASLLNRAQKLIARIDREKVN